MNASVMSLTWLQSTQLKKYEVHTMIWPSGLSEISGHSLQAKFRGPYVVEQQLGSVDYVISTQDRRKTKRVCHVNLLKKYHERDPKCVTCITTEPVCTARDCSGPVYDWQNDGWYFVVSVTRGTGWTKRLLGWVRGRIFWYPGKNNLGVHHIE